MNCSFQISGLVIPIILEFTYTDGSSEVIRIPAEIWRRNSETIKKVFILDKELIGVKLDPFLETADIDMNNNFGLQEMNRLVFNFIS